MRLDTPLKRCFQGLQLLLVVLATDLQARAFALLFAEAPTGVATALPPAPCREAAPSPAGTPRSAQPILERHPFDSMPGVLDNAPAPLHSALEPAAPVEREAGARATRDTTPLDVLHGGLDRVRIVPELQAGRVIGLRLFGIRPEMLLGHLGLRNGDRLEAINGFDIATPEKALEAYARLRTASRLSLRVVRRGQPLTIDLNII
jgi:hypothetical protein